MVDIVAYRTFGMKKQIFRIGIKNYPAAHGGVEMCTYNFVKATKHKYNFTIFTVWDNPSVKNGEIDGVKVFQLKKGWIARFNQIRSAVVDKRNTILDFQMAIFIPLAIVFSFFGYNVVSSIHGISWGNPKIPRYMQFIMFFVDVLGANFARRSMYVAKHNYDEMRHWTLRKLYHNPNGSPVSRNIVHSPSKDLVFIGRISIQKNLLNLIDAVEIAKRHLDLYGPIDEREVSHADEFRRKLENAHYAHYCGALKSEEVYDVLGQYKCFVNPSWSEASPVAVMEAGANGLYLYLSDVAGHRNLGFPDVHYFPAKKIDLPTVDMVRSDSNIQWHREHLSIEANLVRYEALYNSFERKK